MPPFRPAARPMAALPVTRFLSGRLGLLALCATLALPLAGCTGKIGEDACISCAGEKKQASANGAPAPTTAPTPPTANAVGQGVGGPTGSPQQAAQAQGPGAASAPGM